ASSTVGIDLNFETFAASIQGTLTAIRDWFRDYKIPDGKPANRFGLGNKPTSKVSPILAQLLGLSC
uniref:Uncharacterized protein n=1 Tax=Aegilops tauschii subsp. strangulata TaxID=200361 RepID=A0A453PQ50_AEGTS